MVSTILGGTGLFLLGMILLTDGLKQLAGDSLRGFLARFTGGRFSSVAAGATLTALVQSSSATTLTTIGFVSAGLLTFEQALGVILGANLGTTSTGWLVSVLGLKFSIARLALPLVGLGALARLLARDRWIKDLGLALAGFGLIFVGIDTLQTGMTTLATRIDPSAFPGDGFGPRLLLVLVGAVMTVVMQSSSAAVATTLTALHSGAIDLGQAAALVVGQNMGTTVTAAVGALGASSAAKRTALAHILFNVLTGLIAFALLPFAVRGLEVGAPRLGLTTPALQVALFHTAFNLLGVVLVLPFLSAFSRLVLRFLPERGPHLTRHLGPVVAQGPLAIDAAGLTVRECLEAALEVTMERVAPGGTATGIAGRVQEIDQALVETREHLAEVRSPQGKTRFARHVGLLHAVDHLDRLTDALQEQVFLDDVRKHPDLGEVLAALEGPAAASLEALRREARLAAEALGEASAAIAEIRKRGRAELLRATAAGTYAPAEGSKVLETVRWVDRLAFHVWRAAHHLAPADPTSLPDAVLPGDGDSRRLRSGAGADGGAVGGDRAPVAEERVDDA